MKISYRPYYSVWDAPNIVVDSAPREGTVLTLSHWPSVHCDPVYRADTSAEMAINYLARSRGVIPAPWVTASHYDVDALVSLYAFSSPEVVLSNPALWVELAFAGDFEASRTDEVRQLARALEFWADEHLSPISSDLKGVAMSDRHSLVFDDLLPRLGEIALHPKRLKERWQAGEILYARSMALLCDSSIDVIERPELDLTIIRSNKPHLLDGDTSYLGFDAFAIHRVAQGATVAMMMGDHYCLVQRYESWIQFVSRSIRPRQDLAPLCAWLSAQDQAVWEYDGVQYVAPVLAIPSNGSSSLTQDTFISDVTEYLAAAPGAWNPMML
ncbi:DUF6687 family protein [Pseudomonas aeruginosa]|jgi:hypothetical protein